MRIRANSALSPLLLLLALLALAPGARAASAGKVNFVKPAESDFDIHTKSPSPGQQAWMRDHYARMRTYAPYFDSRVTWFPSAWTYENAYAIYPGRESGLEQYILKDANGNRLYIPFACSGGTCPQYAADIGDPGWRKRFIDIAQARAAKGYKGIFVDDVNFAFKVGDGNGNLVAPIDKRTGAKMTLGNWQLYFAEFMEELRASLPAGFEIVQNQVYFDAGLSNPYVKRAIEAATHIEIERGVIDTGIQGGGGTYGFETVLAWVDYIHSRGKGVVWDAQSSWGREYQLATYFLTSNGLDSVNHPEGSNPDNWWRGYDVDLGAPLGARHTWNGLLRRDFEKGIVLVNQPGQLTKTVTLSNFTDLLDTAVPSLALSARQGAVLRRPAPAPPATDTTPPKTTITGGPVGTVMVSAADFTFLSDEPGAAFECRLDEASWAGCSSPKSFTGLGEGAHKFEVRAKDAAGNLETTPPSRSWTVALPNTGGTTPPATAPPSASPPPPPETSAPDTTISGGPTGTVTSTGATFRLISTSAGNSFDCRLDGAVWKACKSPVTLSRLSAGSRTFQARARDARGKVDPTPASRTWTIAGAAKAGASAPVQLSVKGARAGRRAVVVSGQVKGQATGTVSVTTSYAPAGVRFRRVSKRVARVRNGRFQVKVARFRRGRWRVFAQVRGVPTAKQANRFRLEQGSGSKRRPRDDGRRVPESRGKRPAPPARRLATERTLGSPVTPGPLSGGGYIAIGSASSRVSALQRQLTAAGFRTRVDGVFGRRTEAALRRFQAATGLLVDGIVGRQTMAALEDMGRR